MYSLRVVFFCCLYFISFRNFSQKDLPNPSPDIQSIPAGSYVIPMDTIHQGVVPAGQAAFNLKAYGLVNKFLQNGIPVKWAIKSAKQLNDIDFTATAERITPSPIAAASLDFSGGPFIVPDTTLPCGVSSAELISSFGDNVSVYKLTQTTSVDIRYTLTHRPKVCVFNNGGNELLQTKVLDAAGISNYQVMDAADISELVNCYTFASEAHADVNQITTTVTTAVKNFVLNGGNFLAQCDAISSYESKGLFHSDNGITILNTNINNTYPNADLAFSQMHGSLQQNPGGSISNWTLSGGSNWQSYFYPSVTNGSDIIAVGGAHIINPTSPGGNVFYLGGHDYGRPTTMGGTPPSAIVDLTSLERINGLRLYLNAVFIPSGNTHVAWVNVGAPTVSVSCGDSVMLGCIQTSAKGSTYLWKPATGLSCPTCANPKASPSVSTTYTLVVTNGCVVNDTVRVLVAPAPPAQFSNTSVCVGTATQFKDETLSASYWKWDFGDPASAGANTSAEQNPTHTFSAAGNYSVSFVAGVFPNCLDTLIRTVVVDSSPVIVSTPASVCSGSAATLTASGGNEYTWAPATGLNVTSGASVSANPPVTTTYTITGTNASGCKSSTTVQLTVSTNPVVTATPATICSGNAATLTANGADIYSWSPYTGLSDSTGATVKANPLVTTTYTVTGTNTPSGCKGSVTVVVKVNPLPVLTVTDVSICSGGHASLTVSGAYTYAWEPKTGLNTYTEPAVTASPTSTTTYTIIGTDKNGCKDTALDVVTVNPLPTIAVSAARICPGDTATLTATGAISYTWAPSYKLNTITGSVVNAFPAVTSIYTITGTNAFKCSATATTTVTVSPVPEAYFSASPNPASVYDPTIHFLDASVGAVTWDWQFGDSLPSISKKKDPFFTYPKEIGSYLVHLLVTNQYGCKDSTQLRVSVKGEFSFYVPNTFTPDNDGINDGFTPKGSGVDETNYDFWVFDRWGNMIWHTSVWGEEWNGIANNGNHIAQIDTYVWKAAVKEKDTHLAHSYVGHVNIVK